MPPLSGRQALEFRKRRFVEIFHATARKDVCRAYEMSHIEYDEEGNEVIPRRDLVDAKGNALKGRALENAIKQGELVPEDPLARQKFLTLRGQALLEDDPVVRRYLRELDQSTVEKATVIYEEMLVSGSPKEQRMVADRVLRDEADVAAKKGFDVWAKSMCEAGATIRMDLPHEVRRDVECTNCGHGIHVRIPLILEAPLVEMLRSYLDSMGQEDDDASDGDHDPDPDASEEARA